jgi:uncharacterized protein
MSDQLSATAVVPTDVPARYLKQLVAHLGRKAEVRAEEQGHRLVFGAGSCLLLEVNGGLRLDATAETREDLQRVEEVVGRHLERFGQRDRLVVAWHGRS